MSDILPDNRAPLSRADLDDLAFDWADFRKDYGGSPAALRVQYVAYVEGWSANRARFREVRGGAN